MYLMSGFPIVKAVQAFKHSFIKKKNGRDIKYTMDIRNAFSSCFKMLFEVFSWVLNTTGHT